MQIFLPLLCVLCATPVHGTVDGTCPRKTPPPGVLVLTPGSKLVLTCSGHVEVDGVKVNKARNSSNTNRRSSPSVNPTTVNIISNTEVSTKSDKHTVEKTAREGYSSIPTDAGENKSLGHSNAVNTTSPSTHTVQPTGVSRLVKGESNKEDEYGDYEEEGEEGGRVTRGIKSRLQWKWNGKTVGKEDREITFERRGASLSLSTVRLTDAGRYTCYHKGRQRFSVKVNVADPPETPSLSCYKRSPSSKIRCEWAPQKPFTISPNCSLLLSKSPTEAFLRLQCSYSSLYSRCWCAMNHNDDELRTLHMAYLCVTSVEGNATSSLLSFIPLNILKPDPPSDVSVRKEEGQETRMTVSWNLPKSWKSQDRYYELIYEIKYRPLKSSLDYWQIQSINDMRSYSVMDAMPGVEYQIQLRTKEEYDGHWSDWSAPIYESSWTAKTSAEYEDLASTTFSVYTEGSGADGDESDVPEPVQGEDDESRHVLWLSGSFALLSVILAFYIFRHKDRFMSKLLSLSVVSQRRDSLRPMPSSPTASEGHALVTFAPPRFKEPPRSEVEGCEEEIEEQHRLKERIEAIHFNNTSYFFFHRE
ncbi:LOW QUALITY PROTEIN: interleukin-6 receptor subunit alpha [Cottoperca gobio]|uniref:LOW QUALITY PROTEIN: interleukin-6 receptor subunit alpha n=1 Tax=Cottoperca gobio TaxID=56716 RepID=A0A6J2RCS4_COTGO|nr:LOW QUALITY PROTEIN: interleukin-6 receptor subunit alpha-like [Cottoperca gobio]